MNKKGFTIIELIVVIAIIAVLASIVLVNVVSYINKGKDAAIKGNLSTILTNMAVYRDNNADFTSFCLASNTLYQNPASAITTAGGTPVCAISTATNPDGPAADVCACSPEKSNSNTFCIDSKGNKKESATVCGTECAGGAIATSGTCL